MGFVEVNRTGMVVLVSVVYLPRGNVDIFESMVSDIFGRYNNIIVIMTDLCDTIKALRMRSLCDQCQLCTVSQFQCSFLASRHAFICACFDLPLSSNRISSDYIEYHDYSMMGIRDSASCAIEEDFTTISNLAPHCTVPLIKWSANRFWPMSECLMYVARSYWIHKSRWNKYFSVIGLIQDFWSTWSRKNVAKI